MDTMKHDFVHQDLRMEKKVERAPFHYCVKWPKGHLIFIQKRSTGDNELVSC